MQDKDIGFGTGLQQNDMKGTRMLRKFEMRELDQAVPAGSDKNPPSHDPDILLLIGRRPKRNAELNQAVYLNVVLS
jgi:hypothetical protein